MVVEIKADVDNARAIANDMDSYGESVAKSGGRCSQESYSRDTAFGEEFMRRASAYTRLLQETGANIGEAMSGFSQRVCDAAEIFERAEERQTASINKAEVVVQEAVSVVGKTRDKTSTSGMREASQKNESDGAFEPLLSLVDGVANVFSAPPLPPKTF